MNRHTYKWFRMMALMTAIMIAIGIKVEAQTVTVTEGLYYLGSHGYYSNTTANRFFLCPTEPNATWNYYYTSDSPYYTTTNTDQPFMTTYQCKNGSYDSKKALWVIKDAGDGYFHIIHVVDGKYLTYNVAMGNESNVGRMRVHLQSTADGDNAKFKITYVAAGAYDITTKNGGPDNNRKYLNVTGNAGRGNQNSLIAANTKTDGPKVNGTKINVGGIIGLWTSGCAGDTNGKWYPESVLLTAPTISMTTTPVDNTITIADVNNLPAGYEIRYTMTIDGSEPADPTATTGEVYDPTHRPTVPADGTRFKAVVVRYGVVLTEVASATLDPAGPHAPQFSVNCDNKVEITCDNIPSATIYYTISHDGSDPADPDPAHSIGSQYEGPFVMAATDKAKAIAVHNSLSSAVSLKDGFTPEYSVAPVIRFTSSTTVEFRYGSAGRVYYTMTENGSEPAVPTTTAYTGTGTVASGTPLSITIDKTKDVRIRAIAQADDRPNPSCNYVEGRQLPEPGFTVNCDNKLELSTTVTGSHIYYTTSAASGTPASPDDALVRSEYTSPITLNDGDKLKVVVIDGDNNKSFVADYTYHPLYTATPTIEFTSPTTAVISCATEGAEIYYTVSTTYAGTAPTESTPTHGTAPLTLTAADGLGTTNSIVTIRAIAKASGREISCGEGSTKRRPEQPNISVSNSNDCDAGTYTNRLVVSGTITGYTYYYAVTSGENTAAPAVDANPNPYTPYGTPGTQKDMNSMGAVTGANAYYTVHAYSVLDGVRSAVTSKSHQMKTPGKPELVPPTGSAPVVGIDGGQFGDVAVCTIGENVQEIPVESSGDAVYTIPDGATGTLTVVFKRGNWQSSCPATYVLPEAPETPTWSQTCDNILSLHCNTDMAEIHYTINGDEVTRSSATYVEGCLEGLSLNTRVRAKAYIGFRSSGELDYTYTASHAEVPQFFVDGTTVTISAQDGATIYYTMSVGSSAGVTPADPDDPSNSSAAGRTQHDGSNIYIAGGGIITVFRAVAVKDGLAASCVVRVETREGYSINVASDLDKLENYPSSYFFVLADIDAGDYPTNSVGSFTGVLDGGFHTISNLGKPLFYTITSTDAENNAAVHGLILKDVNIASASDAVGAIANTATGYTRIYNCGIVGENSNVICNNSEGKVGSLVGVLDGEARVINCYSYANVSGGAYRGGLVGYNSFASKSNNIKTMVMNCMYYGNISTEGTPTQIAPIYGGEIITNVFTGNNDRGLNNYNYFRFNQPYIDHITTFNCALGAQDRFLQRFEFFRNILNSNRELAMWYVSGSVAEASERMGHWVLDTKIAPYPILKAPGTAYPSIINPDAAHAAAIDADNNDRNMGRKLGTLTVNIQQGNGEQFTAPTGAAIKPDKATIVLNITDKDPANYNFNYKKVQLPYYNEVGTGNYTNYRVVTGWKIVSMNHTGTHAFTTENYDYPNWNFVDRACTGKDLYDTSGRIFNQGAYWEVPDGVTAITIEPYWAKAAYLSDPYYDMTYKVNGLAEQSVTAVGARPNSISGGQTVNHNFAAALTELDTPSERSASHTVYDYAIVLVGNYHKCFGKTSPNGNNNLKPVTVMSADFDNDNEPDNTFFYQHTNRLVVAPIRFDFLNMPGVGMAQKATGSEYNPEPGIFHPKHWFEITNTVLIRFSQFEYSDHDANRGSFSPTILQGGIYEQFVSGRNQEAKYIQYLLIGGNAWFKNFANGCHTARDLNTPKAPVNVAGGDYENFYLSGIYRPQWTGNDDNAECYVDGGHFGEMAGAGMQIIKGDVTWLINGADIDHFYGGGINDAKPIRGSISTTISNSHVGEFCGGPKFGSMNTGKTVTTTATNCHFGTFFGAGYGGTAFNHVGVEDQTYNVTGVNATNKPAEEWNGWVTTHYTRGYETSHHSNVNPQSDVDVNAISVSYDYEYMFFSGAADKQKVARFYINYATLSLAETQNVSSTLTGCTLGNFYGGGKLGAVKGNVNSTLTDCTVTGNVFGSGFSAEVPTCKVMTLAPFVVVPSYNNDAGVFNDEQVSYPQEVEYIWKHADAVSTGNEFEDDAEGNHYILTTENLDNLGAVLGNSTLTIAGNSVINGDVYGGGAKSSTAENKIVTVNIDGGTIKGNVYGGGMGDLASLATRAETHADIAVTEGRTEVHIGNESQDNNNVVINGNVFGGNNINGTPKDSAVVHIWKTKHNGSNVVGNYDDATAFDAYIGTEDAHKAEKFALQAVYGGGNVANYEPLAGKGTSVHIHNCDNTVKMVYGGGRAAAVGTTSIPANAKVIVDGGRIDTLFAGGDGHTLANEGQPWHETDNPYRAANIYGDALGHVRGGYYTSVFGASNTAGTISGTKGVTLDKTGPCATTQEEMIGTLFGGGNKAPITEGTVSLTVKCGTGHITNLYGGSNLADITGNVVLTLNGGDFRNVFAGSKGEFGGTAANITGTVTLNLHGGTIESAFGGSDQNGAITGKITVNVEDTCTACPLDVTHVYGAGNLTPYSPTNKADVPEVNIKKGTVKGNVFGGGLGETAIVTASPKVTVGDMATGHEGYVATVQGNIYGGGDAANVQGEPTVLVQKCNTIVNGDVYGGGKAAHIDKDGEEGGNTHVTVSGGNLSGAVFGGGHGNKDATPDPISADVAGSTNVLIQGGTINQVFGGSNSMGAIAGNLNVVVEKAGDCPLHITELYGGGNLAASQAGNIDIRCTGGAGEGIDYVYGGANQADIGTEQEPSNIVLNINDGHIDYVFGGNNTSGTIWGSITVNINQTGSCWEIGNVFGGGNLANYAGAPVVNVLNGTVSGNVYGGGNGDPDDHNKGTTTGATVTIGDATRINNNSVKAIVLNDVYGGGNAADVNGTPTVTVVNKCNTEVGYVYGGGNAADVNGTQVTVNGGTVGRVFGGGHGDNTSGNEKEANVKGNDTVIITGGTIGKVFAGSNLKGRIDGRVGLYINKGANSCDMKIGQVYGGGNLAASKAGKINVGCTGPKVTPTPGNRYGYQLEGIGAVYGGANQAPVTGNVVLNINSGVVDSVFGGNNISGLIGGTITVNINQDENSTCQDDWYVGYVFGGGNEAPYEGVPIVDIIKGKVTHKVFGGGNKTNVGGATVWLRADGSIGEGLYGGCNESGTAGVVSVNVGGGTVGTETDPAEGVFGGGYGANTLTNNNVNVSLTGGEIWGDVYGGSALGSVNTSPNDHTTKVTLNGSTIHGNLYGGGLGDDNYAAAVKGKVEVLVNSGTVDTVFGCNNINGAPESTVKVDVDATGTLQVRTVFGGGNKAPNSATTTVNMKNGDIPHCIYGGGNKAGVGSSVVNMIGGTVDSIFGGCNAEGTVTGSINVNIQGGTTEMVFGGGLGAATLTDGNVTVTVENGNVTGDVYGGSALGKVNDDVNHLTKVWLKGGTITGNLYGGGLGKAGDGNVAMGQVNGQVEVLVAGGSVANVFGCNNTNGAPQSTVHVTVEKADEATMNVGNVYGGGNLAAYTGSPLVDVIKGAVDNVYGGGKGTSAIVTGDPVVTIKGTGTVGKTGAGNTLVSGTGDVYGGGDAAAVTGNTQVKLQGSAKVLGNVYGGGNNGAVSGSSNVTVQD